MKEVLRDLFNIKTFIPLIIAIGIIVVGNFYSKQNVGAAEAQLTQLQGQYAELENQYAQKKSSQTQANQQAIKLATGVEEERKNTDDSKITTLMSDVVTWSSYAEYCTKRQNFIDTYGGNEDFLNMFFPEIAVAVSADGTEYNTIDTLGLKLQFSSMKSYIINISGTTYSYFALVNVTRDGDTASTQQFAITYSTDASGNVLNLKGIM
jgi:hypothetical protein